jgi:uncharacterized protein YbjT (DUF2867 family)
VTESDRPLVAVVGTGLVGSAVAAALREQRSEVITVHAPRLLRLGSASWRGKPPESVVAACANQLGSAQVVVNAAGDPDASSRDVDALEAANGWLPLVLALGSKRAGCSRYIHVSTSAVQGRRPVLDASPDMAPFSPYSRSKAVGEARLRAAGGPGVITYRPPSVHAVDRRVTRITARVARSPLSSVISPGDGHSPQALIQNVGSALAHLALTRSTPPQVVIHPWEGLTTAGLLLALGGSAAASNSPHAGPELPGCDANDRKVGAWCCRERPARGDALVGTGPGRELVEPGRLAPGRGLRCLARAGATYRRRRIGAD